MENAVLVLGSALMVLGVGLFLTAIFRALGHTWTHGVHEIWLFPVAGVCVFLVGFWLIQ